MSGPGPCKPLRYKPRGWGEELRRRQHNAGMSAWELADLLGVHEHDISLDHLPNQPLHVVLELARRLVHPRDLTPYAAEVYNHPLHFDAQFPTEPAPAARLVELRMQRQQILHTPGPARLWVVIDEAVLHRPFCTAPAMRAQIQHLIAMSELPHITIQVLPFRNGGRVAAGGPVVLLRFPNNEISDVVYLEQLASAVVLDKHADVSRYLFVMNCLATEAEEQEESRAMLRRILKDS